MTPEQNGATTRLEELFRALHERNKKTYRAPHGTTTSDHAVSIAIQLAAASLDAGHAPEIYLFTSADHREPTLRPLPYGGHVSIMRHSVCVIDGVAHDPILATPYPLESYAQAMFDGPVDGRVSTPHALLRTWFPR